MKKLTATLILAATLTSAPAFALQNGEVTRTMSVNLLPKGTQVGDVYDSWFICAMTSIFVTMCMFG